jgi:hypothetical protein
MPQVLTELDPSEVMGLLKRRGYGLDSCHGYAFRLSVRKHDEKGFWYEPIGGVRPAQWKEILITSTHAQNAADRVEMLSRGIKQEAAETAPNGRDDLASLLYAVDNRIDAKLNAALNPVYAALSAISKALNVKAPEPEVPTEPVAVLAEEPQMTAPIVEAPAVQNDVVKKKPGWPKGKPRGPRKQKPASA